MLLEVLIEFSVRLGFKNTFFHSSMKSENLVIFKIKGWCYKEIYS